jgi:DNA primase
MEFAQLATREPTLSSGSSLDAKERVKQAVDIVDLVGSFIQLRRQGRNFVGLCPWHDDSRPSLQVNPERQSFKCWVCDIGGDVFSFIMQMEGVTFPEALAMLAERAGIALKPSTPAAGAAPGQFDKRTLYRVMAWVEQQYHDCLLHQPEGEPGRQYLRERGLSAESIEQFHLGFSPEAWDWILRRAENKGPSAKMLESVGVIARGQNSGRPYDRFRGRALFSIRDSQGRPVGLGGRVLPSAAAGSGAKYVNSPETPLFSKSKLLYGLDMARDEIRRSRTVVVMEGYTDCIIAHQFGFQNVVAVLGTALGPSHLQILKRFADRIILVLDGDEAGQRRANEVLELFVAEQVDLRIVTLPDEKDPCDYLQRRGADAFRDLLVSKAVDALEHAFQVATRGVDVERDIHGATQAMERLLAIVAKAPRHRDDTTRDDRLREEKILQRLAARFRIHETEVRQQLTALRRKSRPTLPRHRAAEQPGDAAQEAAAPSGERIDPWERVLLEVLIQYPQCVATTRATIAAERIASPPCRRIYEACCRLSDAGTEPSFEKLMLEFDQPAMQSLLVELDENGHAKGSPATDPEALIKELIRGYEKREAEKRGPAQTVALREGRLDEEQATELLAKIVQQKRTQQGISFPTDG